MEISILNLTPIKEGQSAKDAIDAMVRLAKHAENIGIKRYWIAEHHNMKNLASSATQLLIAHVLASTSKIRVGSGGVMLPNHSPYAVAEQYGTLETFYPNRVELGLGRAPGTDMQTAYALRKGRKELDFASEIAELRGYFDGTNPVSAYPAKGLNLPFYILGSSTDSAYLAAQLGLPYAFASHFAPRLLEMAVAIYRQNFKPSKYLNKPYVIVGANVIIGENDEEAAHLATTQTQFFLNVVTGAQNFLQPPVASDDDVFSSPSAGLTANNAPHFGPIDFRKQTLLERERMVVEQMTACSFIGSKQSVSEQLREFYAALEFDEIMAVSYIFDEQKQFNSYSALKEAVDEL